MDKDSLATGIVPVIASVYLSPSGLVSRKCTVNTYSQSLHRLQPPSTSDLNVNE